MGKTERALTSLVAAIPAGLLTYLLIMVYLSKADALKTMTHIIVGLTLVCAVFVTFMPIGLLVLGDRKPKEAGGGKSKKEAVDADDADDDVEDGDVIEEGVAEASDPELSSSMEVSDSDLEESDEFVMEDSDADIMSDSSGEFVTSSESSLDEIESVEFEDEEEEEPKPKKKKK